MFKKRVLVGLIAIYSNTWAAHHINLHQAPVSTLSQFKTIAPQKTTALTAHGIRELQPVSQVQQGKMTIIRYQQLYQGIPIVGAQVTVSKSAGRNLIDSSVVNGHLFDEIDLETVPTISSQQALLLAKKASNQAKIYAEKSQLQIRVKSDNQLQLVYWVSFKSFSKENKPLWPNILIDAHTGMVINQWNNIQTFADTGPGGNEKTHEYWYGKDNLPSLEVNQESEICTLEDKQVRLVNLHSSWDREGRERTAFTYPCNNNAEDLVNGAYSVGNDAYYFGHTIINLYKDWYGVNALQDTEGNPQQLIMRVHFGSDYDNAFWDGEHETMTFGDGYYLYPLVSLDIATHEVSHGFTQQHANLEYHDQPGALNEAFSDMAGQTARAYLLETYPALYNKAHITENQVTWGIGETVVRPDFPIKAIRFMDLPSKDGESADCLDKKLARSQRSICAISYPELLVTAKADYPDPDDELEQQNFIVHTASGVFNRAFYLMSRQVGIKTAFHVMLLANAKYWTPTTDFNEGACGVMDAARDLSINVDLIQSTFKKVGIDVTQCIS